MMEKGLLYLYTFVFQIIGDGLLGEILYEGITRLQETIYEEGNGWYDWLRTECDNVMDDIDLIQVMFESSNNLCLLIPL